MQVWEIYVPELKLAFPNGNSRFHSCSRSRIDRSRFKSNTTSYSGLPSREISGPTPSDLLRICYEIAKELRRTAMNLLRIGYELAAEMIQNLEWIIQSKERCIFPRRRISCKLTKRKAQFRSARSRNHPHKVRETHSASSF